MAQAEKFIVLFTSVNSEIAFGPFDSIESAQGNLEKLGFTKINGIWWQKKPNVDAYIKQLNPPDEVGNK